jgi:molecular chaperone GrpE
MNTTVTGKALMQQIHADNNETEKTASGEQVPAADTSDVSADTSGTEPSLETSGTNLAGDSGEVEGKNPAESGDSADETLAEGTDSINSDAITLNFTENAGNQGENGPNEADLNNKIAELEEQLTGYHDQLLRKAADFENFRKRMNQEKQNAIEFANQTLLLDIIPVIDDFERAIQSAEASAELAELPAGKAMLDGITMIEKRLTGQLEAKWGLKRFNSAGEPFDPNRHEAMLMEKSSDVQEPVVQEDFVKGYMLKERVIRAAKVKVIMPEE